MLCSLLRNNWNSTQVVAHKYVINTSGDEELLESERQSLIIITCSLHF